MQIHFIGIGGCGMNGVAHLTKCAGHTVTGSDRADSPELFQCLKKIGIGLFPQDGSGITGQTDVVVYSTAIESNNPEIQKSNSLNIPLLHRAEMLAKLCEGKEVIAVAGTAGKSTVTGLLGWIFQCLEKDPTVYCGAPVLNWKQTPQHAGHASRIRKRVSHKLSEYREASPTTGNVRFGTGPWIIEADESDKSFLHFHPDHAIITNIAEDHFSLEELHELFDRFESQVSGVVVKAPEGFNILSPLIGKHNVENVNNALTLCKALGLDLDACLEAVSTFKGIERRLERLGDKVIDDFAHSPVKISAALEAVSGVWPAFNAVWRPHGYTPLFQGLENFTDIFSKHWKGRDGSPSQPQEKLYILPVYYAGGTVEKKITSEQFVEKLQAAGVPAEFVPDFQPLEKRLLEEGIPVLIMGARDPELPRFAEQIAAIIC